MKTRVWLTTLWFVSFVSALLGVLSFALVHDRNGVVQILLEDYVETIRPLIIVYGAYIAGILAFWYKKPFQPPHTDAAERVRCWLALGCTLLFNALMLFFVLERYFTHGGQRFVSEDIAFAVKLAALLSFIVAPVNAYFFGMKPRPA